MMGLESAVIILSILLIIYVFVARLVSICNKYLIEDDPAYQCEVFRKRGCSHIDGQLWDMKTCSTLYNYRKGVDRDD
jgi:hypothetical protein